MRDFGDNGCTYRTRLGRTGSPQAPAPFTLLAQQNQMPLDAWSADTAVLVSLVVCDAGSRMYWTTAVRLWVGTQLPSRKPPLCSGSVVLSTLHPVFQSCTHQDCKLDESGSAML